MGRKIPAKKHRGVKDPLKQQAQRFASIKNKINAPPTDPDEQPVPRSLTRLFAFQQPRTAVESSAVRKKGRQRENIENSKKKSDSVAGLRRMPGEDGRAFSRRITLAARALSSAADTHEYPMDDDDADSRGAYIAAQRERRQRKTQKARAAAARAAGDSAPAPAHERERLSKQQRRALKRKEEQKAKAAETEAARSLAAREVVYERVSFGDVAHAPPALTAPRRTKMADGAPRPGRRELLLTSMLGGGASSAGGGASKKTKVPAAEAARLERARLEAVAAYRSLKAQGKKPRS